MQAGAGGNATATAYASNDGEGDVRASATAWGRGGEGLVYGAEPASATAEGHSTGGGDVLVDASLYTGSDGSDIVLVNAVSGSTSGLLELRQDVRAEAPIFWRVQGGDVVTGLVATNPGGGDLELVVNAQAATTRPETGVSNAVIGDVIGTSTTGANVEITVTAEGGWGSQGAPEAGTVIQENRLPARGATTAAIYGESNGGDVSVFAYFKGGQGGQAWPGIPGGDGAAMEMIDVATGDTTGNLSISQRSDGGGGGSFYSTRFAFEVAGNGGVAYSELTKATASTSLTLHSEARGGGAFGGTPATATAISDAFNSAGTATAYSRAIGGIDGLGALGSGDAFAIATARTTGDGNAVFVGGPVSTQVQLPLFGARGGSMPIFHSNTYAPDFQFANGGDGTSHSTGIAEGDSMVTVIDQAFGGNAGSGFSSFPSFGPQGFGGNGGDASSTAVAMGAGTSTVKAESRATGGTATILTPVAGSGGDAEANASATGAGAVESIATAVGGESTGGVRGAITGAVGQGGDALAWASAEGASGFARAEATTGLGLGPQIHVVNEAQVGSRSDVVAQATIGSALSSAATTPGLEGMAFATANPHFGDVATALAGNTALTDVFATEPAVEMLALAQLKGSGRGVGASPVVLSTGFEIVLSDENVGHQLVLGAFDVSALGPILSLSFGLERNGEQIGAIETFDDVADVLAFFANWVFQFDGDTVEGDRFGAYIDLELAGDSMFGMGFGFAAIIPEPGTGSLLVFGLAVFASVSRPRRRSR